MESFADYILAERDWVKKLEIMYYLRKKQIYSLTHRLCSKRYC